MRGYLSVAGADTGVIPLNSRVEIFRDPDGSHAVIARTQSQKHDLGVSDVTVSRRKNGTAPILIEPHQSMIEIHNKNNTNGVTVVCEGERTELDQGLTTKVKDTARVTVGHQTKFRLTVEKEAKTEINVGGDVSGDVVAGDQRNVDERTQVVDSVVNRSDIGGDTPANVEDSVVNRSSVGSSPEEEPASGSDTQKRCERHNIMYRGDICPKCLKEGSPQTEGETKFCIFCGATIPERAAVCPDCGEEFRDATS